MPKKNKKDPVNTGKEIIKNKNGAQSLSRVQPFCDPTNCRLPGSSVHGVSQARILEWIAISLLYDLCLWTLEKISKI